jgi:hypothetical protein
VGTKIRINVHRTAIVLSRGYLEAVNKFRTELYYYNAQPFMDLGMVNNLRLKCMQTTKAVLFPERLLKTF